LIEPKAAKKCGIVVGGLTQDLYLYILVKYMQIRIYDGDFFGSMSSENIVGMVRGV
jgi:type IV secretory pathway protease TraF